ncbi:DUF2627 domain-containing protein [Alteribacillus bidgolensis]|uniref:DUF2627 domain-containing protein n=1 Tax=Alteribacillus bidgolensis TaxID=930129 RepID=A0A1G8BS83_9BACI|nr:DUF2627 domain-containing protein [Alteribacillus bidgolensis]SDH35943.1 Protein of unknown function [Alteribacillus bidgolensis]
MRLIALLILVIPGIMAALGIKLMRDMLFQILQPPFPFLWLQFLTGLLMLVFGIWFISGFVFYRDRKNKKVGIRYQSKTGPSSK